LKDPDAWYKSWFNTQDYLDLYKHRDTEDARKIIALILKQINPAKGSKVLDLACGNGRHSILFARSGFNVTGVDLSNYLIKQAKEKLKNEYEKFAVSLNFKIKDMRCLDFKNEFDMVVNVFSSFGYFESDEDNEKVIHAVADALKKGGFFLIDFLNRDYLMKKLVPFDIRKENRKIIVQVRRIYNNFVEKNILIFKNNEVNALYPSLSRFLEKIKLYSVQDFERMFSKNRLRVLKKFGNYLGDPYNQKKSERLILLAQKI
jgi:SAM-dependent methyltransferase